MSDSELLSPERQRQILRGAALVFSQDGYEGASMSRIAACAGVSKGSLYNYFDSKAALFEAWIGRECADNLSHIFSIADPDGDPADALRAIGERMLRMMVSQTGLTIYRLTVAEAAKFPELARAYYEAGPSRAIRYMAAWLERQTAIGRLHITDPAFAAEQFFTLCQTRVAMMRRLGLLDDVEPQLDRVVDCSVTMFLNTYGVPHP